MKSESYANLGIRARLDAREEEEKEGAGETRERGEEKKRKKNVFLATLFVPRK